MSSAIALRESKCKDELPRSAEKAVCLYLSTCVHPYFKTFVFLKHILK